ncbi:SCO6745 family protein [Mycolicibacterium gadium]|jgi:hypothetical protein|uniref:SCO6745 family protein n=1 Tax=Mycolicibacterium gadium TaxID=1794 RepID=UPI002FDE1859
MAGADSAFRATRILAGAVEAFAGQVYFAPEAHAGYEKLGFSGSPGRAGGVAMPEMNAYFCSRGAILGQVPGEVVASAFAVFNPAIVVPAVEHGWSLTSAAEIIAARDEAAAGQLRRILGADPDGADELARTLGPVSGSLPVAGRPLYAGLMNADVPEDSLSAAWRFADRLREFRGDAHTAAWTSAGYSAIEIGLTTELYWGLRPKTYVRTRGWSDAELDAAIAELESRGLIEDGALTDRGRREREAIETRTDAQCAPVLRALGDDFENAVAVLRRFSDAVRAARGYPAAGPHDLAALHAKH